MAAYGLVLMLVIGVCCCPSVSDSRELSVSVLLAAVDILDCQEVYLTSSCRMIGDGDSDSDEEEGTVPGQGLGLGLGQLR